ncbi:sulfite oxidase [Deinococcus sp. QL22]|uniref:sulfite oxidase n=1 Tax=Deinococcus sp. QL22 TaxID=2939437 RepID=UPI0020182ACA|nr:sulfite oxidase [Deinococcus sp. QL22]UQN10066.1 sulfite oxidase [Deinococcus sp. QL22]
MPDTPVHAPVSPAMIVRQSSPANLEFPFHTLSERLTPPGQFYVRSHFPVPELNAEEWRLEVGGLVGQPLCLTLADLQAMTPHTVTVTLECAGNSRSFLTPKVAGVAWDLGAVSTAEWTGVPLSAVLERAGLQAGAREVVLCGADRGCLDEPAKTPGIIAYERSLPLNKAQTDVLLAYAMNGEPLTPQHGYPVRAIVPGWYGMASVKWLTGICVTDTPFQGFFQTLDYSYWESVGSLSPQMTPLSVMQAKAQIARPAPGETVAAGKPYVIMGAAWTGEAKIIRVEISTDGGQTWAEAELTDPAEAHVWRRWRYLWHAPDPSGTVTLLARATDSSGQTQPTKHTPERGKYMITFPLPIAVMVE